MHACMHAAVLCASSVLLCAGLLHAVDWDVWLCRIRNPDMTPCEGVMIQDMGHKIGCNGVDNGQLIFNHYVAPRWAVSI